MRHAIFITGTGKSGTTLASKAFFDAGVPMGDQTALSTFAGGGGNPKGVWEHQEMMDCNKAILEANHLQWFETPQKPLTIPYSLEQRLQSFVDRQPTQVMCFKDPRFTWTTDIWKQFYDRIRLVICFRSPLGFVKSAYRVMPDLFDKQSPESLQALEVWQQMNQQLLTLSKKHRSWFFSFDDSFFQMKASLHSILNELGYSFQNNAFQQFYVPEARHKDLETTMPLPEEVHKTWELLQRCVFHPDFAGNLSAERQQELETLYQRQQHRHCSYLEEHRSIVYENKQLHERYQQQQLLIHDQSTQLQRFQHPLILKVTRLLERFQKGGPWYESMKSLYFRLFPKP